MRTRSKMETARGTLIHIPSGNIVFKDSPYGPYPYEVMTDERTPPGPLSVDKGGIYNFSQIDPSDTWLFLYQNWPIISQNYCNLVENRLNWKKLPTSNQADILTALAEFDDTIAMFGKKLASSLSYGGYKWGWTPLLSDISAINDAANNVKNSVLDGNRRSAPYNATDAYTAKSTPFWDGGYEVRQTAEVKVKFTGEISYENDICSFYDFMGFHPSPKLLWDLVPMSFAIDYVLPIGDALSNITPSRGWVKYANFTGWRVTTVKLSTERVPKLGPNGQKPNVSLKSSTITTEDKRVSRSYCRSLTLEQKDIKKDLSFKMPTIEQAFDIGYLANTLVRGRKR